MATITPSLSAKVDARGKSEILLRFVGGKGHVYRVKSGIFIPPDRWKDGGVAVPRIATPDQRELKAARDRLAGLSDYILEQFAEADKAVISRLWLQETVRRFHHPDLGGGRGFFGLWEEFERTKDVSATRRKRFKVVRESLKRFEAFRGRPLTVEGIDAGVLEEYRGFLAGESETARLKKFEALYEGMDRRVIPGKRSKNTIIEYLAVLRTFYRWLNARDVTAADPFKRFEVGATVYGTPYYLTIEERDALYRADLSKTPTLEAQRDIFVFQCLVGCRVGDLLRFKKSDIVDGVLTYIPRKTREGHPVVVRVPLTDTAREIVERYAGFRGDQLLPFISSQKYDAALKRIFKAAGVTRVVTVLDPLTRMEVKKPLNEIASSHLARRTFIGNLYRQVKDPALIGSMTGHVEGSRAFARYRAIDDDLKTEVVRMLEKGHKDLPGKQK